MRGVDLNEFDFDFDLTWAALFMNADGHVYGRYGSRYEGKADAGLSLKGLKYAMSETLKAYRKKPLVKGPGNIAKKAGLPERPELYPAARRVRKNNCIHCHQVFNFRHDLYLRKKKWSKDRMWVYPPPKSIGLHLERDQGDRVKAVVSNGIVANAGLRKGDVLETLNGERIASAADVHYALNRAPQTGRISVSWLRDGKRMAGTLSLTKLWRKSDISWRESMWSMPPSIGMYGRNLSVAEKRKLGLKPKRLAFRQGNYVPPKTRRAGIRARDIIIGINDRKLEMKMRQFNVYVRENFKVGDRVVFRVIRNGKRMDIRMTLPVNPR